MIKYISMHFNPDYFCFFNLNWTFIVINAIFFCINHLTEIEIKTYKTTMQYKKVLTYFLCHVSYQAHHSRKEVFQPHLPVRLPCYDLAPVTNFTLGRSLQSRTSGTLGFHGLTGGVYKARERIHRAVADARLLANPASRSRVADFDPNWEKI